MRKRHSRFILANASRIPLFEWVASTAAFRKLSAKVNELGNIATTSKLSEPSNAAFAAIGQILHSINQSPQEQIKDLFNADIIESSDISMDEHELTDNERLITNEDRHTVDVEDDRDTDESDETVEPDDEKPIEKGKKGRKHGKDKDKE